jgi:hypothetical protein
MKKTKRPNNYWTEEKIRQTLAGIVSDIGHFPSSSELKEKGFGGMLSKIYKRFGCVDFIRKEMGYAEGKQKPTGYWRDFENVRQLLFNLTNILGHFPKCSEFRNLGYSIIPPVIVKYYGGMNTVREKLGFKNNKKSFGYWKKWENLQNELDRIIEKIGHFPTFIEIIEINSFIKYAIIRHHGGINSVRKKYSLDETKKSNGYWKLWENVERGIKKTIDEKGHFPTQKELTENDLSSLATAITKYHGGFRIVRSRMGYIDGYHKEMRYWNKWENLEKELREVIEKLGHFPNQTELIRVGKSSIVTAMNKYGGLNAVKKRMGYQLSRRENGTLKSFDNAKREIYTIIDDYPELNGQIPNSTWFRNHGHSGLLHAINRYHGSFSYFMKLLGKNAKQDSTISMLETILEENNQ